MKELKLYALVLGLSLLTTASAASFRPIEAGAKVCVDEMPNHFDQYIKAEILKKKIPVRLLNDCSRANYKIQGASNQRKRSWHEGWLTNEKDQATGAIEVIDREDNIIWAAEAGDRSIFFAQFKRQGPRKVAGRLAGEFKKAVQKPGRGQTEFEPPTLQTRPYEGSGQTDNSTGKTEAKKKSWWNY